MKEAHLKIKELKQDNKTNKIIETEMQELNIRDMKNILILKIDKVGRGVIISNLLQALELEKEKVFLFSDKVLKKYSGYSSSISNIKIKNIEDTLNYLAEEYKNRQEYMLKNKQSICKAEQIYVVFENLVSIFHSNFNINIIKNLYMATNCNINIIIGADLEHLYSLSCFKYFFDYSETFFEELPLLEAFNLDEHKHFSNYSSSFTIFRNNFETKILTFIEH